MIFGTAPAWLKSLAGGWSWLPLLAVAAVWLLLQRLPFHAHLMAVGSDDRAAFTAGVPVAAVRFLSYLLAGLFAWRERVWNRSIDSIAESLFQKLRAKLQ